MGLNDIFNTGKEFIVSNVNKATTIIKKKHDNVLKYNMFITSSENIKNLKKYNIQNEYASSGREKYILGLCLNLNNKNAKIINELIPIMENIIKISGLVSSKTNIYYNFVLTDKSIWLINEKEFTIFSLDEVKCFDIIDSSIMNQYVNFNNIALNFECMKKDITFLQNLILNKDFRKNEIDKITVNLCGIIPIEQYLTENYVGISIDKLNNLILHNGFNKYFKISINEINDILLLIDNTVIVKKSRLKTQSMLSFLSDCHSMTLKIVTDNKEYYLNIISPNSLTTLIKKEDSLFINSYQFAQKIINRLSKDF